MPPSFKRQAGAGRAADRQDFADKSHQNPRLPADLRLFVWPAMIAVLDRTGQATEVGVTRLPVIASRLITIYFSKKPTPISLLPGKESRQRRVGGD